MSKIPELAASVGSQTTVAPVRKETTASGTKQAVTGRLGQGILQTEPVKAGAEEAGRGQAAGVAEGFAASGVSDESIQHRPV